MIEAPALWGLAGDTGYPAVQVGRCTVHGQTGWRRALFGNRPAVPKERLILLRALEKPLLVSTPGARARLRAWIEHRRTSAEPPMSPKQRRDWLEANLLMFGDEKMAPLVLNALERVPAFVSESAVHECAFLLVGQSLRGWFGSASMVNRDGQRPAYQILVAAQGSAAATERVVCHEAAHFFIAPPAPEAGQLATIQGDADVRALAAREAWPSLAPVERERKREERAARGLEEIWATL